MKKVLVMLICLFITTSISTTQISRQSIDVLKDAIEKFKGRDESFEGLKNDDKVLKALKLIDELEISKYEKINKVKPYVRREKRKEYLTQDTFSAKKLMPGDKITIGINSDNLESSDMEYINNEEVIKEWGKSNIHGLRDFVEYIEIITWTGKKDLMQGGNRTYISDASKGKSTDLAIQDGEYSIVFDPYSLVDKKTFVDLETVLEVNIKMKGIDQIFSYFGVFFRKMYIEFLDFAFVYEVAFEKIPDINLDNVSILFQPENIGLAIKAATIYFGIDSLDFKYVSVSLLAPYFVLEDKKYSIKPGLGVGVNIDINDIISFGIGYDITNSIDSSPALHLLIGKNLGVGFNKELSKNIK